MLVKSSQWIFSGKLAETWIFYTKIPPENSGGTSYTYLLLTQKTLQTCAGYILVGVVNIAKIAVTEGVV